MKKKGFTLIELLAVIIILAIIALIATPIIMNVIEKSRKGAAERSADNYLDSVETAVATEKLEGTPMTDGTYVIDENGNLCKEGVDCTTDTEQLIKIEMSGNKPTEGTIVIENGVVVAKNSNATAETELMIGDYEVKYDENNVLTATVNLQGDGITKICTLEEGTALALGSKYTCDTGEAVTRIFYVLSINEDDTVNLIMDGNLCEDGKVATDDNVCQVPWYSLSKNNEYGPVTAMQYLYNATKNWANIPNMVMNYTDEVTSSSIITDRESLVTILKNNNLGTTVEIGNISNPLKARLPEKDEVTPDGKCMTTGRDDCPKYLLLSEDCSALSSGLHGYWLVNSYSESGSRDRARYMACGNIASYPVDTTTRNIGVRPVITISKEQLG